MIICADALDWLNQQEVVPNVITGICDLDEIDKGMDDYIKFFQEVATEILSKLADGCYAIFIQTDRKWNRQWIDKSYILTDIAQRYGLKTIWHKIVLHRGVGATHLQRPTYAHMLCYSRDGTTGAATPDVLDVSNKLYKNATPLIAAQTAVEFVARYSKIKTVLDPFVGQGTIPAVANKHGLDAIGIDIDQEQCTKAKNFRI